MALDPLNPFDDPDEQVTGPEDLGDRLVWRDRNGFFHRTDGPAIQLKNGRKVWVLHNRMVTEQEVAAYRQNLEARRLEAEKARETEAAVSQLRTGLDHEITVKKPLSPRKKK